MDFIMDFITEVLIPIAIVLIIFLLVLAPFARMSTMSITAERDALQDSLNVAREAGDKLELAAVTNTVANFNKELANQQYYASLPIIGWYYSSNVLKTEPVR